MRVRGLIVFATLSLVGCSDDTLGVAPPRFTCARPDEAPLPDERGGARCLRVGAREGVLAAEWPDVTGFPTPVVYVRAGAGAGGDGSRERPWAALSDALSRDAATVALARGGYTLDARVERTTELSLVGADPAGVTVGLGAGAGITSTTSLRVQGVTLRARAADAETRDLPLTVTSGATMTLDDVVVDGGWDAVTAQDATLVARHLTVRRARHYGVSLTGRALGILRSLLVRDGAGAGVVVDRARVHVAEALVAAQGRGGVTLSGDGDAAAGASDCDGDDPRMAPGPRDCLRDLAVIDAHSVGVWARGRRAVEGQRLLVARTQTTGDDPSADGVFVSDGADVTLDPAIATESMQGRGSIFADNARSGVVVDGGGVGLMPPSRLVMTGAWIDGNARIGAFAQNAAVVPRVAFCRFVGNGGIGFGAVPSARIASIGCNGFLSTRPALLPAVSRGVPAQAMMADGLSVANVADLAVTQNAFDDNARYGAVFLGASGRLDANRGAGNLYGLGVYESPMLDVAATNRVVGRAPTPTTALGVFSP